MQVLKESVDCKELCRIADEEMAAITGEVMAVDLSYKATLGTRTAEGDRAAAATMTCMNEHVQIMSMVHLPDSKAISQEAVVSTVHIRNGRLTGKVSGVVALPCWFFFNQYMQCNIVIPWQRPYHCGGICC